VRQRASLVAFIVVILVAGAVVYMAMSFSVSALQQPGRMETSVATRVRDWSISRAARRPLPAAPEQNEENISKGSAIYGMACATCHGQDGRNPTPIGKSMYPRVPDLSSPDIQRMSDQELFWVVKNGVRLSGMPGFAKLEDDGQIWCVVFYVHSLRKR
jgi:mono/diheme cytochrome c family protein